MCDENYYNNTLSLCMVFTYCGGFIKCFYNDAQVYVQQHLMKIVMKITITTQVYGVHIL